MTHLLSRTFRIFFFASLPTFPEEDPMCTSEKNWNIITSSSFLTQTGNKGFHHLFPVAPSRHFNKRIPGPVFHSRVSGQFRRTFRTLCFLPVVAVVLLFSLHPHPSPLPPHLSISFTPEAPPCSPRSRSRQGLPLPSLALLLLSFSPLSLPV